MVMITFVKDKCDPPCQNETSLKKSLCFIAYSNGAHSEEKNYNPILSIFILFPDIQQF